MATPTLVWHKSFGSRFTFVGPDVKVVELASGGFLVQQCIDKMPIHTGNYHKTEAVALSFARSLAEALEAIS